MERLAIICTTCLEFVDLSYSDAVDRAVPDDRDWLVRRSVARDQRLPKVIRLSLHRLPRD